MRLVTTDVKEIFGLSREYFDSGKGRCTDLNGFCRYYRESDGHRCVVGNLLVEETPTDLNALKGVRGGVDTILSFVGLDLTVPVEIREILKDLQAVHDRQMNWSGYYLSEAGRSLLEETEARYTTT